MLNLEVSPGRASERCGPRVCVECMNRHLSPRRRSLLASLQGASVWGNEFPRLTPWARGRCPSGATLEFGHFERVTLPRGRCGFMIGVGTTDEVAPPSEPSRPISGTRLSSWWLISKGDQPTHPDSFRVRAMDGSCCQGGQQTPNTS